MVLVLIAWLLVCGCCLVCVIALGCDGFAYCCLLGFDDLNCGCACLCVGGVC